MSERRYQLVRVRVWLTVGTLILLLLGSVITIEGWFLVLPEAAAVTIDSDSSSQWAPYIKWHESWKYLDANIGASNSCPF